MRVGWKWFACVVKWILQYDPNRHWSSSFPSKSGHRGCQCWSCFISYYWRHIIINISNISTWLRLEKYASLNSSCNLNNTSVVVHARSELNTGSFKINGLKLFLKLTPISTSRDCLTRPDKDVTEPAKNPKIEDYVLWLGWLKWV